MEIKSLQSNEFDYWTFRVKTMMLVGCFYSPGSWVSRLSYFYFSVDPRLMAIETPWFNFTLYCLSFMG